jgi:ubiquitin carboxyl-terminal hydrolase 7
VTKEDTPPHLQKKLDEEAALREMRRKEREEQHLYLGCKVITEDTYRAHGATDLTSFERAHSEDEPAAPRFYRLLRKSTVKELMEKVGADTNVDPKKIRFWAMVNRQNKTIRPDAPITDINATVEDTYQRLGGSKAAELRLWAEVAESVNSDGDAIWPATPTQTNGNGPKTDLIVLFLKWFDVESQSLSGAGHIYISREKKVEDLVPVILKKMGWPDKTQLRLFEVRDIKVGGE